LVDFCYALVGVVLYKYEVQSNLTQLLHLLLDFVYLIRHIIVLQH